MSRHPASLSSTFGLVTPSPNAKKARVVSNAVGLVTPTPNAKKARVLTSSDNKKQNGNETIGANRTLAFGTTDCNLLATQEPCYKEETTEGLPDTAATCYGTLKDVYDQSYYTFDITKEPKAIVSRKGCSSKLTLHSDENSGNTATLFAAERCWVLSPNNTGWKYARAGTLVKLFSGSHVRLVKPGSDPSASKPRQEFQLQIHAIPPTREAPNPGTHSFDCQYLELLSAILEEGEEKNNKKGSNLTLQRPFNLQIDLSDKEGRYLLPLTSLRDMFHGKNAILEALWYLRGENHVRFLLENGCKFWKKQCGENGWVGWSYGLLTYFPQPDGKSGYNQLEENVLKPLSRSGSQSRNMVCSLHKPDEKTVQAACTLGIQFSVHKTDKKEYLDLTVFQRSSDTVLGLPHDVVVWSIILHLVCREVYIRTNESRNLVAGTLYFHIRAGGGHIYSMNMENAKEIVKREPIEECQPHLDILGYDRNTRELLSGEPIGMFQQAKDYSLLKKIHGEILSVKGYDEAKNHPAIKIEQAV